MELFITVQKDIDAPFCPPPIDQMKALTARLGKARTDRIRYHSTDKPPVTGKPRKTRNLIFEEMQNREPFTEGCQIDDIIQGIARLDHQRGSGDKEASTPLSVPLIYNMFQLLEELSTPEIMHLMDIKERQAQKYLRAAKLIMHHVMNHLDKEGAAVPADEQNVGVPYQSHSSL